MTAAAALNQLASEVCAGVVVDCCPWLIKCVHAHFIPEEYREALIAAGQNRPDGIPALPQWYCPGEWAVVRHA
jgi:hypothetical protein